MEYLHELAVLTYWQLFIIHLNDHEVKSRIMLFKPALHRPVSPIASSHVLTEISFNSVFFPIEPKLAFLQLMFQL